MNRANTLVFRKLPDRAALEKLSHSVLKYICPHPNSHPHNLLTRNSSIIPLSEKFVSANPWCTVYARGTCYGKSLDWTKNPRRQAHLQPQTSFPLFDQRVSPRTAPGSQGKPYQPEAFFVAAPEIRESVFSTTEIAREEVAQALACESNPSILRARRAPLEVLAS